MFREAVLAFLGVKAGTRNSARGTRNTAQAVGEYCKGVDVEECRAMFGEGLSGVCATCPE